jgi:hypothetical protein
MGAGRACTLALVEVRLEGGQIGRPVGTEKEVEAGVVDLAIP